MAKKTTQTIAKRNRPQMLVLEPRILFDGAAVATAVEVAQDVQTTSTQLTDTGTSPELLSALTAADVSSAAESPVAIDANQIDAVPSLSGALDASVALNQPAGAGRHELVVVDGGLESLQTLLDDITAADPSRTILILDPSGDEVSQLTQYLRQHQAQLDAIHVLSHGGTGWFSLGDQTLQLSTPEQNAALWESVKTSLTETGDVLIYGCNVASDDVSQAEIAQLAQLTGADIAASTDATGVNGDWDLEYRSANIETSTLEAKAWQGNLWIGWNGTTADVREAAWFSDQGILSASTYVYGATYADNTSAGGNLTATPRDLTFAQMTAGSGLTLANVMLSGGASVFKLTGLDGVSYADAVIKNDYISANFNITAGVTNGLALSMLRFSKRTESSTTSRIALALVDKTTGVITRLSPADIVTQGSGTLDTILDKVGIAPGKNYELRFYAWGGLTYIDNAVIFAQYNTAPTATNDTFSATAGVAKTGNLITVNNGGGLDGDPESQTLSITKINGAAYAVGGNIALAKGTLKIDNTNGAFTFTPNAGVTGVQTFTYSISDGFGGTATATVTINIAAPVIDGAISINNVVVNEASTYVVSEVTGLAGQMIKLSIGNASTGTGYAIVNTDTQNASATQLQYFNGTSWVDYTANSYVAIPSNTSDKMLVRTKLVNDTTYEGMERYVVYATSQSGLYTAAGAVFIYDDGTGNIYPDNNNGSTDPTAPKNDDRPTFSVNDVTVNESAGTMTFTVTKTGATVLASSVNYTISDGSALLIDDYSAGASALTGTLNFASGDTTKTVTINITNDSVTELIETLNITLSNATAATISDAAGVGTIIDDDIPAYPAVNSVTVNEKSTYAVFTVTAIAGSDITLGLAATTNASGNATLFTDTDYTTPPPNWMSSGVEFQYYNGTSWVDYMGGFGYSIPTPVSGQILVRTKIQQDTAFEGPETFNLTASYVASTNNTSLGATDRRTVTGVGTIIDDGTGSYWNNNGNPETPYEPSITPVIPANPTQPIADDDRPVTIDDQTVNEGSPYAVFTVTGNANQYVKLVLDVTGSGSGHAIADTDYTNALEYYNGSTWVSYTPGSYVAMTGATMQVRVAISNDSIADNNETFKITVYNTGGSSDIGTGTIKDDGSGKKWSFTGPNDPGASPLVGPEPSLDDDRPLTITGFEVNEGSPYGVFTVTGAAGQYVSLARADGTATGGVVAGAATDGSVDYGTSLQYFDGTAWQTYTAGSYVQIPSNGNTLLVRTAIVDDALYEMSETMTLTAANVNAMAVTATGTIRDDGQGDYFGENDPTPNPNPPTPLDDDRPVNPAFVDDLIVNEGSRFVVFTVTGVPTAGITLSLTDGTALAGGDYTNSLEYWSGSAWTTYDDNNPPALDNTGKLLVRVPVLQDTTNEPDEKFQLSVRYTGTRNSQVTSLRPDTATTFTGTAWIVDDANGAYYSDSPPSNNTLVPDTPYNPSITPVIPVSPTQPILDDDRPVMVNDVVVNEGSPYAVFTVTATEGQYVKLVMANTTAQSADHGSILEYWDGDSWEIYSAGTYVKVPVDSDSTTEAGNLLVRVTIAQDSTPDNGEQFTLTAFNTGGAGDVGTCTIMDDGSGHNYPNLDPVTPSNPNSPLTPQEYTPATNPVVGPTIDPVHPLPDDDRALSINNVTVNEKSPYAIFTVGGKEGQYVKLDLTAGTATSGADFTNALQYWNGSAWVPYVPGSYVKIPSDGDETTSESANLLVRVAITDDGQADSGETFNLSATNTGGATVTGLGTIVDDGSGHIYPNLDPVTPSNPNLPLTPQEYTPANDPVVGPTIDPVHPLSDDESPLSVNDVTVNEKSPYAVFTVGGKEGQYVKLDLTSGTATGGTDYTNALQYWDGSAWVNYVPGSYVKIPSDSDATTGESANLLVRVAITQDSVSDNGETFTLSATNAGGFTDTGLATIKDDGTGHLYPNLEPVTPSNPNSPLIPQEQAPYDPSTTPVIPANPTQPILDDDRPLSVNSLVVNEGSLKAVFTVSGATNQYVKLSLTDGTAKFDANGVVLTDGTEDYGAAMEVYVGGSWQAYAAGSYVQIQSGGTLLVRMAIVDDVPYEMSENFTLSAFNTGGNSATGTCTILDNGQGNYFGNNNTNGVPETPPNGWMPDDDRPVNPAFVDDVLVNEGSPYAVFRVTGVPTAQMTLTLASDTAIIGTDFNDALEVFVNGAWVAYNGTNAVLDANGDLMVRTSLNNQPAYEGRETFKLNTKYTGLWDSRAYPTLIPDRNNIFSGRAAIEDDGSGVIYPADDPTTNGDESAPIFVVDDPTTNGVDETDVYINPVAPTGENVVDPNNSDNPLADDDRPLNVNNISVVEGNYAEFTVTGEQGQYIQLDLTSVTATPGTDYTNALEYWDGTAWVSYIPGSFIKILNTDGTIQIRTQVSTDGVVDGGERFSLSATNVGGGSASGTCAILETTNVPNNPTTPSGPGSNRNDPLWYPESNNQRMKPIGSAYPAQLDVVANQQKPIVLGEHEFHKIVLNFNGEHGGINRFRPPETDTTSVRNVLEHSNWTPYYDYDRVTEALSHPSNHHPVVEPLMGQARVDMLDLSSRTQNDINALSLKLRNMMVLSPVGVTKDGWLSYALPAGTFVGGKGGVTLDATLRNGKPLPNWLKFNPKIGLFEGQVPEGEQGQLEIVITAQDKEGEQVKTSLKIKLEAAKVVMKAKPSFGEQVRKAAM